MTYKIEMYYEGKKMKHKLYETKEAFDRWYPHHLADAQRFNSSKVIYGLMGVAGFVDGKPTKSFGLLPEKVSKQLNEVA